MARVKSIEEQLYKILKQSSFGGQGIDDILISEAERFKKILAKHIRAYYASYPHPFVYKRRGSGTAMADAIRVETSSKNRSISIYFDDTVWGPSVVDERKWGFGFTPILIDTGWENKTISPRRKKAKPIRMFDYYEGYNFIRKSIDEFEQNNEYGISVRVKVYPNANEEFGSKFRLSPKAQDIYDNMGN